MAEEREPSPTAVESLKREHDKLRHQITEMLGVDRWIDAAYPSVAPISIEEVRQLLVGYPGVITIVGSGTNFPPDYTPTADVLLLLTSRLTERFEHSAASWTVEVSAGWQITDVKMRLAEHGQFIPALERFSKGTVGGRLAAISARVDIGRLDGWVQSLLGLEVITPDGEILRIGGHCIKDVAGYNLKNLFTGSRGAVGVIVSAVFRTRSLTEKRVPFEPRLPPAAGKYDPALKRLFDPRGRMRPGP